MPGSQSVIGKSEVSGFECEVGNDQAPTMSMRKGRMEATRH